MAAPGAQQAGFPIALHRIFPQLPATLLPRFGSGMRGRLARGGPCILPHMATSAKSKGAVKTLEWWKHLRWRKRDQNKLVRRDGKHQCAESD